MKRLNLPFLFILSGGLILLVIVAILFYQAGGKSSTPTPARLAGLAHTRVANGSAAVREIQQLHGKDFEFGGADVVDYDGGRVRLWVAQLESPTEAAKMVKSMGESIARGGSPFTPIAQQDIGAHTVYALEGMNQVHFYFQSGSNVVWLGADPDLAETALDETLAFFP